MSSKDAAAQTGTKAAEQHIRLDLSQFTNDTDSKAAQAAYDAEKKRLAAQ